MVFLRMGNPPQDALVWFLTLRDPMYEPLFCAAHKRVL